nr:hypothetical protein [Tanacetum cinerariifolium]
MKVVVVSVGGYAAARVAVDGCGLPRRWGWQDDGGVGGRLWLAVKVVEVRWGDGEACGSEGGGAWLVAPVGCGFNGGGAWRRWVVDLVDRDTRNHFGVRRKISPKKFFGGGGVVVVGCSRWLAGGGQSEQDMDEIETINIELEHSVAKLVFENALLHKEIEHLKKIYKDQFYSIKKTRALYKEHSDSLIAQLNSKSMENEVLKGQLQEKVFVATSLQNKLRRLKGKNVLDNASTITNATTIAPGMFKLDIQPISHILKNNRDAREDYLKKNIENTDTIYGLVERARKKNPSEPLLDSSCMFKNRVQELLVYVSKTCHSLTKSSEKLVAITPKKKDKKVRFADPVTSSNRNQKQ